jgi:hypothetical protein
MARNKKPIPKNPFELSQETITPYITNEGKFVSEMHAYAQNRATNLSVKGDVTQNVSIGLEDIDGAILFYFDNFIKPTVTQDGNRIAVKTIFGSPERWKSVQQDGFNRDGNGNVIVPLIMIKRSGIEKNRNLGNKIDGNTIALYQTIGTTYNSRNQYDKFDLLNNRIPSKQYYISTVPDYITLTYECIVFTNYVEQNNKIIEAIEFASDSYWGDPTRFKFRTSVDSFNSTTIIENGADRVAKTTCTIKVNGYIIPDTISKDLAMIRSKFYTRSQIVFNMEVIDGNVNNQLYPMNGRINVTNTTSFVGGGSSIINVISNSLNTGDISYLNTNKQLLANVVTVGTKSATFTGAAILQPPVGSSIPATTVNNFTFYIRGQYVPSSIVTLTTSGGDVIFIFNTTALGFELKPDDEIIAIGKFQ